MFAPALRSESSGSGPLLIAIVKMPAATPERMPSGAFSITIASYGEGFLPSEVLQDKDQDKAYHVLHRMPW